MTKDKKTVIAAVMIASVLLGLEHGGVQYILLSMAEDFGMNKAAMGSLVSVEFFAVTIAPLVMGVISDRTGKRLVIIIFSAVFFAGALTCGLSEAPWMTIAGMFLTGSAFGSIEMACSAILADEFPESSGKYMSIMQGVISAGCVISPLLVAFLSGHFGFSWRILFVLCCIAAAASFISFLFVREERSAAPAFAKAETPDSDGVKKEKGSLRNFVTVLLAGACFCEAVYMFMENGTTYFVGALFEETLHNASASAMGLSLFWAAMAVVRLGVGAFYRHAGKVIISCFLLSAAILASFIFVHEPVPALVLFPILGAAYGPVWAFVMSIGIESDPERSGTISSLLMAFGGIGGTIGPSVNGMMSDRFGVVSGFLLTAAVALAGLVVFVLTIVRRRQAR